MLMRAADKLLSIYKNDIDGILHIYLAEFLTTPKTATYQSRKWETTREHIFLNSSKIWKWALDWKPSWWHQGNEGQYSMSVIHLVFMDGWVWQLQSYILNWLTLFLVTDPARRIAPPFDGEQRAKCIHRGVLWKCLSIPLLGHVFPWRLRLVAAGRSPSLSLHPNQSALL